MKLSRNGSVLKVFRPSTLIASIFILLVFIVYLIANGTEPIAFDDAWTYDVLMGKELFSPAFTQTWNQMFRSYSIPLLFWLIGNNADIVWAQILSMFGAWVLFASVLASAVPKGTLKTMIFIVTVLTLFDRGYYHCNQFTLSDSFGLSLLLVWFSILFRFDVFFEKMKPFPLPVQVVALSLFLVLTSLMSNTRDTHVFFVLLGAIPVLFLTPRKSIAVFIALCFVVIAYLQIEGPSSRHSDNLMNVIGQRILPNPEFTHFFVENGMPMNPDVESLRGGTMWSSNWKQILGPFIMQKGKQVYTKFLLTHPIYTLKAIFEHEAIIFEQHFPDHSRNYVFTQWTDFLSGIGWIPVDILWVLFAISCGLLFLYGPQTKEMLRPICFSLFLTVSGFVNAAIAYHGDEWEEIWRHCFIGSIVFRLGVITFSIQVMGLAFSRLTRNFGHSDPLRGSFRV